MESLHALFAMGGYAGYVWPAYGISVVVLIGVLVVSVRQVRCREAELERLQGPRRERRGSPAGAGS
ncbi:heme exporter protein CcmD [Magnetospirillum molischianum]|nr:heme exporter protein CcmD [Magnetospirillum molischianum]